MHHLLELKFNFSTRCELSFSFEFQNMSQWALGMQRFRFRFKAKTRKSSFVWQKYPVTIRRRNKFSRKKYCQVKSIGIEHWADSSLLRPRAQCMFISHVKCSTRKLKKTKWNWMWKCLQENNHLCNVWPRKIIIYCKRIRAPYAWCSGNCSCNLKLVIYFRMSNRIKWNWMRPEAKVWEANQILWFYWQQRKIEYPFWKAAIEVFDALLPGQISLNDRIGAVKKKKSC